MRSPSFTAKTFSVLLFQKTKATEKNNSKLRIKTFKPIRLNFFINKTPGSTCFIKLEMTAVVNGSEIVLLNQHNDDKKQRKVASTRTCSFRKVKRYNTF